MEYKEIYIYFTFVTAKDRSIGRKEKSCLAPMQFMPVPNDAWNIPFWT